MLSSTPMLPQDGAFAGVCRVPYATISRSMRWSRPLYARHDTMDLVYHSNRRA